MGLEVFQEVSTYLRCPGIRTLRGNVEEIEMEVLMVDKQCDAYQ